MKAFIKSNFGPALLALATILLVFSNCNKENGSPAANTVDCSGFKITSQKYSETVDLDQVVKNELGSSYHIVDWNELKSLNDIQGWINCMGFSENKTFMVTRNGEYFYSGNRQYYVQYSSDGIPYSGFLVHGKIGSLYLGSWYGLSMQILGKK